jgi:hypothetical protein
VLETERLVAKFIANAEARLGTLRASEAARRLAAMPAPDPFAVAGIIAATGS